jgi:diadenosine tetraphosphatase ApaH/serine/threonine PP2A family protein phosphatase
MIGADARWLEGMNPLAREAIRWTQQQLGGDAKIWLANLPLTLKGSDYEAVHASLHQPWDWPYILRGDMAELHFTHQTKPVCFIGHTHRPTVWVEGEISETDITGIETLRPDRRQLVNVGSVGQPRDREKNACYAIYRRARQDICWRRVPYDIEAAQKAIVKAGLPSVFALRLELGK